MDKGNFSPGSAADLIVFQIERHIMTICKNCLMTLEDVRDGEPLNYDKQRKRILDAGNTAIRELESQLDLFDINFKR